MSPVAMALPAGLLGLFSAATLDHLSVRSPRDWALSLLILALVGLMGLPLRRWIRVWWLMIFWPSLALLATESVLSNDWPSPQAVSLAVLTLCSAYAQAQQASTPKTQAPSRADLTLYLASGLLSGLVAVGLVPLACFWASAASILAWKGQQLADTTAAHQMTHAAIVLFQALLLLSLLLSAWLLPAQPVGTGWQWLLP